MEYRVRVGVSFQPITYTCQKHREKKKSNFFILFFHFLKALYTGFDL